MDGRGCKRGTRAVWSAAVLLYSLPPALTAECGLPVAGNAPREGVDLSVSGAAIKNESVWSADPPAYWPVDAVCFTNEFPSRVGAAAETGRPGMQC